MSRLGGSRTNRWQEDENEIEDDDVDRNTSSDKALDNRASLVSYNSTDKKSSKKPPPPSSENIYRESLSASLKYTKNDTNSSSSAKYTSPLSSSSPREPFGRREDAITQQTMSDARKYEAIEDFGKDSSASQPKASHHVSSVNSLPPSSDHHQSSDNLAQMKRWLMRPCNRHDPAMLCQVERERSGFGLLHQIYRCYLEINNTDGTTGQRFLMSAKKMPGKKTSYYLVSLESNPDDRGSDSVLGKIRGNAVGSQYLLTDHGIAPDKTVAPSMLRKELGIVNFVFDSGGPSQIQSWIPTVNTASVPVIWQPVDDHASMMQQVEDKIYDRLLPLHNKQPKWDDDHGGHVLNFQGRVSEASVKNFQLCVDDAAYMDEVVLQFGRIGKNSFTMDVRYPLSPFQAFSICVACMDNKIADRKGYEFFKKLTAINTDASNNICSNTSAAGSPAADGKDVGLSSFGRLRGAFSSSK